MALFAFCCAEPNVVPMKDDPEQRKKDEEAEQRREAAEAKAAEDRRQEQEKEERAEEARRREKEEEEDRIKREGADARQREMEEKAWAEQRAKEDAEARGREQQEKELAAAKAAEDKEKLEAWMKMRKIKDVSTKKSLGFFSGSAYPLHIAVKEKDAEMVRILLANDADPTSMNSSKLNPFQFAEKLAAKDKTGAYDAVVKVLQ
uniref:Uncharacterized protein n=1 Tax=Noctiluca scintillans TaxID=2966 RepID=A0A7S1F1Y4_NOCSC